MPDINMSQLIADLKEDEGVILHEYRDSLGFSTIGSGILIDQRGGGITDAENDMLLENRVHRLIGGLDHALPWVVLQSDNVQRALINVGYQLGLNGLLQFKEMLQYIRSGLYDKAADEGMNSSWAKQTPNRAKKVTDAIRNG
jgi:lysozyme